jgi:predicted transporter
MFQNVKECIIESGGKMEVINVATLGIVSTILMFGIKTGLGCGFADLRKYEIVGICSSYFVISMIMGCLVGTVSREFLEKISGVGLLFHVLLASLMIIAGIYTQKQWNCGCDVSRRTFVFLSLPCPVCLTALFIATTMLANALDLSSIIIGVVVGSVFFLSAVVSSLSFRRLGKTPETLGSVIMFLGVFYVLGAVLIPAHMQAKTMTILPIAVNTGNTLASFAVLSIFIAAGFILHHRGGC